MRDSHAPPEAEEDFGPPPEVDRAQHAAALAEPGPSWKTWTFETGLRPYFLVLFLILDAWIVLTWAELGSLLGLLLTLLLAVYVEFLLYRYLWARPHPDDKQPFRPSWHRPVWAGRWTPEGARLRAGEALPNPDESRKRDEFL
jgi:hypothetical protein